VQVHEIHIRGEHARLVVGRIDVRDVHLRDRLDGPGPAPAPSLVAHVQELAEAENDAALRRLDLEEAAGQPQSHHYGDDHEQQRAALAAFATRAQQGLELALPALHTLVQIGPALARPPSPWIVLTARLIPSHMKKI
jgi:hypothetical protein